MDSSGKLNDYTTDLSPIMSSYLSANTRKRHHLHPELINVVDGVETCDFCVKCIELMTGEQNAEVAVLESEVGVVEFDSSRAKILLRSQKLRESSMSIAAGYDYGVLARISELKHLSFFERIFVSPNRLYYLTVKVTNPMGLPGAKSLKGDVIPATALPKRPAENFDTKLSAASIYSSP